MTTGHAAAWQPHPSRARRAVAGERRAGRSWREDSDRLELPPASRRPMYARVLVLQHVDPGGILCFVFLEGMIALGGLLTLAELSSWQIIIGLPLAVAVMVKLNDIVAGALRPARRAARIRTVQTRRRPAVAASPVARQAVRASAAVRSVGVARVAAYPPAGEPPPGGGRTVRRGNESVVDPRSRQSACRHYR